MDKDFTNRRGGGQKLNRLRRKVGAILIEFAFAIPVFLILIYYIHDLPKQKLMQRRMQFVTYEMAAILQNIAKQKTITCTDISNSARLAWLSMFPGITQYSPTNSWDSMPLGYLPIFRTYYVMGTGTDKVTIKWLCRTHAGFENKGIYGTGLYAREPFSERTLVKSWSGSASNIYPNLHISQAGGTKIIVEAKLYNGGDVNFSTTGQSTANVSKGKLFGFLLFNPKCGAKERTYFNSIAIFTPQGKGFSATPPAQ